jgi:hypothetical protein
MAKQLGNSGIGTDGPAEEMTEEERRKAAHSAGVDPSVDTEDRDERRHRIPGDDQYEQRRQPGGGRPSESEKPASPASRWGGGR